MVHPLSSGTGGAETISSGASERRLRLGAATWPGADARCDLKRVKELPIACTLTPRDMAARASTLLPELLSRAREHQDLPEGFRLRFDAASETLHQITAVIDAERQCCRFLQFQLTVEPDGGPLWLEVSGPPGTRSFLAALALPGPD